MYRKNAWENLAEDEKEQLSAFAKDYMAFLNNGKTERECVAEGVRQAEAKGFKNLMDVVKNGETLKAGDRVYRAWMNKDIMLFIIGELAWKAKAGRVGTVVLFFVLSFGMLGFIAKTVLQKFWGF